MLRLHVLGDRYQPHATHDGGDARVTCRHRLDVTPSVIAYGPIGCALQWTKRATFGRRGPQGLGARSAPLNRERPRVHCTGSLPVRRLWVANAIDGESVTVLGGVQDALAVARRLRRPGPRLRAVRFGNCRWRFQWDPPRRSCVCRASTAHSSRHPAAHDDPVVLVAWPWHSARSGLWACRPQLTRRATRPPPCSTPSCASTSRPFALRRRACATVRGCRGSSTPSSPRSCGAASSPAGSPASGATRVGPSGSSRSRARGAASVRVAAGAAWPNAPPTSWTTCCRMSRCGSGS